jgi:hypothetical protein
LEISMHLGRTDFLFWAAGLLAHLVLLVVIVVRHRAKSFPFFTTLIAMDVVRTITLYLVAVHGTRHTYRVSYSCFAILDLALQLCVAYEIALHVFRPAGRWAPDIRRAVVIAAAASAVVAAALTCLPQPPARTWMAATLIRGNFFSSVLMCELFVGMIVLSMTVGLPWKPHVARIAQGLGFYCLIEILTEAGHNLFGMDRSSRTSGVLTMVRMVSYLMSVTYWIVMLWRDAPAPRDLPQEMRKQLFTLQRFVEYDLEKLRALKAVKR